jgi:nicotinamide-nucleotide adenylyltransferase
MMEILAEEVMQRIQSESQGGGVGVDIAVTKYPYFVDKAREIEEDEMYRGEKVIAEQIHLIGYDTLIRLLSPKYYPPKHTLESLVPFLERHRVEVTYRTDDSWGGKEEQDLFLKNLREGKMKVINGMAATLLIGESVEEKSLEKVQGKAEWVEEGRIVMMGERKENEEIISSTKVREAAQRKDGKLLEKLVTKEISQFILERGLYVDE